MSNSSNAAPPPSPSLDVAPHSRLEPLRPMPLHEVQRAMSEYQQGLQAILDKTDWQTFLSRQGEEQSFVVKSGWRKIATWFGFDLLLDDARITIDRDEQGRILRARVVGRVVAPNGRKCDGIAVCSIDERHFSKPEHDLVSTAATRAINRATSDLVGMGDVSAEEVMDNVEPMLPLWAQGADKALEDEMLRYLEQLYGSKRALDLANAINNRYGYVPNVAAGIVRAMWQMWRAGEQPPAQQADESKGA
jgi:hypothetical protein